MITNFYIVTAPATSPPLTGMMWHQSTHPCVKPKAALSAPLALVIPELCFDANQFYNW